MKFEDIVNAVGTLTDLRRIASAYVVDYSNLNEDALRKACIKAKPQFLHEDSVRQALYQALYRVDDSDRRVLSRITLIDVLLNQDGFFLPQEESEEKVINFEKDLIDKSNETELIDLACNNKSSPRFKDLDLYFFVLKTAWENEDRKSPDEANLLFKLRNKLSINEWEHRILEARLGKFPRPNNELHNRSQINDTRRFLQCLGLLFSFRDANKTDYDIIPLEIAKIIRSIFKIEIKYHNYKLLLKYKAVKKKGFLKNALKKSNVIFSKYDNLEQLKERVIQSIPPSALIGGKSHKLSNDELSKWCSELNIAATGSKHEKIKRIIEHYDNIRYREEEPDDERAIWYNFYKELACRDYDKLRAQHIIDKDVEIEKKFEEATAYLFENKLNLTPLKQMGTSHPDGLLSFRDMYIMWDNKSKESPVNLHDHLKQFDGYIRNSEKSVPIFLVISPGFTQESEPLSIQYAAENFGNNIVLILAKELKNLAEEWHCEKNKKRDEPFPIGLLNQAGCFSRNRLGKIV